MANNEQKQKAGVPAPGQQYGVAGKIVMGAMARSLRMVAYEEERRSRDDVILALESLRARMAERGVDIPAGLCMEIFFDETGTRLDGHFWRICKDARQRKAIRAGREQALEAVDKVGDLLAQALNEIERVGNEN